MSGQFSDCLFPTSLFTARRLHIVVEGDTDRVEFANLENVLSEPDTQMRIFGKPEVKGHRRMAVLLARGKDISEAREKTGRSYAKLQINVYDRE